MRVNNSASFSTYSGDSQPIPRYSGGKFFGHLMRILAVLSALALIALFAAMALLLSVGHWLVKQDDLQKADAIAVLSGGFPMRALEAASLYRNGYAGEIWLTNPGRESQTLKDMGIHYPSEADFNREVLLRQGVPANAIHILDSPVVNTADELDVISSSLQKNGASSVIVVTEKAHTRRVRTLWTQYDAGRGMAIVHGVTSDAFDPNSWWRHTEDTRQVVHEMLGMVNVYAGMPMRTRLHEQSSMADAAPRASQPQPDAEQRTHDPTQQE